MLKSENITHLLKPTYCVSTRYEYLEEMNFTNKVVLVTGASSGIGAAAAIYFAKLSAKLALVGRNEENLLETVSKCEQQKGIKPLHIVADITIEADVERIVKETIDHFQQLDVLINNAGISKIGGIKSTSLETYDAVMNTNVRGTFYLTSLAVPHLVKTKGNIVINSSISSLRPHPSMLVYTMSKAVLDHFTKNIAVELGPAGVRVNSVNPGVVPTDILYRLGYDEEKSNAFFKQIQSQTPLRRLTDVGDTAALIAFLASDRAKNITGGIHAIDGGRHLT